MLWKDIEVPLDNHKSYEKENKITSLLVNSIG